MRQFIELTLNHEDYRARAREVIPGFPGEERYAQTPGPSARLLVPLDRIVAVYVGPNMVGTSVRIDEVLGPTRESREWVVVEMYETVRGLIDAANRDG